MKILFTDRAWGDAEIEREMFAQTNHTLIDLNLKGATEDDVRAAVAAEKPDALLVCFAPVPNDVFDLAPITAISRTGIGLDNIPLAAAAARGVRVTNNPTYCVEEVADHTAALVLAALRHVPFLNAQVHGGTWNPAARSFRRLSTLTAGLVGAGRIGSETAARLAGLGIKVIAYDPGLTDHPKAEMVGSLAELQARADVISLHSPLLPATHHLVDAAFLEAVKPGCVLVNASRGGLIDTEAAIAALDGGTLSMLALDTLENEPNVPAALLGRDDVILTPHVAFASVEAVEELRRTSVEELLRAFDGRDPINPVSGA